MSKWSLHYASKMDKETLNRIIPTTSSEITMDVSLYGHHPYSTQEHSLHKPIGKLDHIVTLVGKNPKVIPPNAYIYEKESTRRTEWEDQANEALQQHFAEEPIVLPNKVDVHHPDNHRYIRNRVISWVEPNKSKLV